MTEEKFSEIEFDIKDEELQTIFEAYMKLHNYSEASVFHFKEKVKETKNLNEAMGMAVFNEFIIYAVQNKLERHRAGGLSDESDT